MSIRVYCRTKIDKFKREVWPKKMACRPLKGDAVEAESGAILHVVGVTHGVISEKRWNGEDAGEPFLTVELHKYYPGLDRCTHRRGEEND